LLILHNGGHDRIVEQILIEAKRFIVLDVTEIFSIVVHAYNLDKDIGGLFLLILHKGVSG
jgi:hypothetical protein